MPTPASSPSYIATSPVRLYSLQIGDWAPSTTNRYTHVQNIGHFGPPGQGDYTPYIYPSFQGIFFTLSATQTALPIDVRPHLPQNYNVTGWTTFQAAYPGLQFVGEYTPAFYNKNNGELFAIPNQGPQTDFLTAINRANVLLQGAANPVLVPWVIQTPVASQFMPNAIPEIEGEETSQGAYFTMPSTATTRVADDHEGLGMRTCSGCGRMGHNTRTCATVAPKAYDKIGVELEGRYLNLRTRRNEAIALTGGEGYQDGSVSRSSQSGAEAWEFQTKPGSLSQTLDQVHKLYPDEADKSCGMHIHMSFAPTDIFLLNNTEFFSYFHTRWAEWGTRNRINPGSEFWKRLNGENTFCRVNTVEERDPINMDRYFQLNFSAWERHKTVECRLLPMFRKESLALSAIQELVSIYEDWFAMDHAAMFPVAEVSLPAYNTVPDVTAYTVEPPSVEFRTGHILDVASLPAPAHGLTRIAIPTGRTMDNISVLDRFRNIKIQERQAA